jgi:hypothetical protein
MQLCEFSSSEKSNGEDKMNYIVPNNPKILALLDRVIALIEHPSMQESQGLNLLQTFKGYFDRTGLLDWGTHLFVDHFEAYCTEQPVKEMWHYNITVPAGEGTEARRKNHRIEIEHNLHANHNINGEKIANAAYTINGKKIVRTIKHKNKIVLYFKSAADEDDPVTTEVSYHLVLCREF